MNPSALALNKVPILPLSAISATSVMHATLYHSDAPVSAPREEVPISYHSLIETQSTDGRVTANGLHFVKLTITVLRVGDLDVEKLSPIVVVVLQKIDHGSNNGAVTHIIQAPAGGLLTIPPTAASPTEQEKAGGAKGCSRLPQMCRFKAAAAAKIAKIKAHFRAGCPGSRVGAKLANDNHRHSHHNHGGNHRHGGHRGNVQRVRHIFKTIVLHVLLPILIGVAAGMTASLLGLVVGALAVKLWQRFYIGETKGAYFAVRNIWERASEQTEKVAVDGSEDVPPVYADEKVLEASESFLVALQHLW